MIFRKDRTEVLRVIAHPVRLQEFRLNIKILNN